MADAMARVRGGRKEIEYPRGADHRLPIRIPQMTAFIPSFATQQLLPPWEADACVYGLAFPIPQETITNYVDTYFNAVDNRERKFHFSAASGCDFGILLYTKLTNVQTLEAFRDSPEHPHTWDSLDYNELIVCVPILRKNVNALNVVDDSTSQVEWCQPLAICNNNSVIFSTREVIGLDVLPGKITESPTTNGATKIDVELYGVSKFSPTSKEGLIKFLEITIPSKSSAAATSATAKGVIQAICELSGGENCVIPKGCLPKQMDVLALKQFRDACDMDSAIYQALVTFRVSRHKNSKGEASEATFYAERAANIELFQNATTNQIIQTFLGQPGATAARQGGASPDNTVTARRPTLVFKLDCRVVMDEVKTDFLLS
jgi:hypothetical protein